MKTKSAYTKAETEMILCMTRSHDCTPEKCRHCVWLSDKDRIYLQEHGDEPQWEKEN
jgi:hypothetical protein